MDIADFRELNHLENIIITQHSHKRLSERTITMRDIIAVIHNGQIIEEYPDDFPFPSCLILGKDSKGRHLHVVAALDEGLIYLITAYIPSPDKWEADLKTRKDNSL